MIKITLQECLEKPATLLLFIFFPLPANFWLQLEPVTRAEADAAEHWHHCREGFSYSALFSKGFHSCWSSESQARSFDEMPCAARATQKHVIIIVVAGSQELTLHPVRGQFLMGDTSCTDVKDNINHRHQSCIPNVHLVTWSHKTHLKFKKLSL